MFLMRVTRLLVLRWRWQRAMDKRNCFHIHTHTYTHTHTHYLGQVAEVVRVPGASAVAVGARLALAAHVEWVLRPSNLSLQHVPGKKGES